MKKLLPVCSGIAVLSVFGGSFAATDPMINKLMREKQQKMEQLEQCAKKVNGFKIAGISTLGLTAVGIGGNVALASKQKGLNSQIEKVQTDLDFKKTELANINSQIAAKEEAARQAELTAKKDECAKQNGNWVEAEAVCSFVTPTPTANTVATVEEKTVDEKTVELINGSNVKPNIGTACSEKEINDKLVVSAVFAVAGGNTGIAGDTICTQNGQDVPCVCSATKCVDGAKEVLLAGGIKTCEKTEDDIVKKDDAEKPDESDNVIVDLKGRVINGACNSEDMPRNASAGIYYVLGRKFTVEKDKWASTECYASANSKNIVNCSCKATQCKDQYNLEGGVCKKAAEKKEKDENTSVTFASDVDRKGLGYTSRALKTGKVFETNAHKDCKIGSSGDWCTQFLYFVANGTSTCVADYNKEPNDSISKNQNLAVASTNGRYCYCKRTSFVVREEGKAKGFKDSSSPSSWVFRYDWGDNDRCQEMCASSCAAGLNETLKFRKLFY